MLSIRPATHAGSWYSGDPNALKLQIQNLIASAQNRVGLPVEGARVLIGPHAGYTYSGERLAETYNAWDTSTVKRVFLLGPSHHVYFKNHAMLSPFDYYETPIGNLQVDQAIIKELLLKRSLKNPNKPIFKVMSQEVDEEEHSFEMHAPFISYQAATSKTPPTIIPIMISGMDSEVQNDIAEALLPYILKKENHFVISSDFCHWGSRFGYMSILPNEECSLNTLEKDLVSLEGLRGGGGRNYKISSAISNLDKLALCIATNGSSLQWKQYIRISGNTICGQKPISIVLQLIEKSGLIQPEDGGVFQWIGYSQSNSARSVKDSSVSWKMSESKLFAKSKSTELKAELEHAFKKSKPANRVKIVLRKILANIILNNNEMVTLMGDIIPLMKMDDLEIRKLCCEYIVTYGQYTRDTLAAIPLLKRFREESSPILRALSVKTMTSVCMVEFSELSVETIQRLVLDKDPYVRQATAFSIARLHLNDPARTEKASLIDLLNELLYDESPMVVSNALAALSSITERSKSLNLTIDKAHTLNLIKLLKVANEWQHVYLLNSLMAYIPQSEHEALDLIEAVLPSLQHEHSAVVLNAIKVIVYYSNYASNPELHLPILPKRIGSSLNSLLTKSPEIQFLVLRNVILLLLGKRNLVQFEIEMFYCKFDDPIYVKDTKLEIIYLLANEENVDSVLNELEEYATEVDVSMARKAIRAFGNLAVKLEAGAQRCVDVLCDLISTGISYIVQEAAIVVKNIIRRYPDKFNYVVRDLIKHRGLFEEPDAKVSILWMVGQFCVELEDSGMILDDLMVYYQDEPTEVQLAVLTAVTKHYLVYPSEGESRLLNTLKWATEKAGNPDVRDRGYLYWRLLSSEYASASENGFQKITKDIIFNLNPLIVSENDNINPAVLEELELNFGSLASIYLKPVQSVFRMTKHKELHWAPSLQKREPTVSISSGTSSPRLTSSSNRASYSPTPSRAHSQSEVVKQYANRASRESPTSICTTQGVLSPQKENFTQKLSRKSSSMTSKLASKFPGL
ncbi:hypothetical protein KGF56_002657 [Candida oxycetoniae]|uniref:Clathrin/coatomer adaptor adaptin-like N-terminal domain-containing protein n=1 Tax=Candida oxycetoniae TaxID=497107 RepID=A0AAI9WXS9_9ASCO|nr:uncharacterized protein KGF56_002657 [Candida oxycetoniae]KAI3404558.2 hypothetical protein KGF56_002657 [Candida oxycetoniae]